MELSLKSIKKEYGDKLVLDCISFSLEPGLYGILGSNGSGKTTLFRIICGLMKPTQGAVFFNGKNIVDQAENFRDILDLGLFSFPLEWNHLQVYFWFLFLQFTGLLFTAGVTLLMSSILNSPLSVLSFSISLYLLPYFLVQIFREGVAQKLLYLFPINQQSVGKLLGLFASNREYFFQDFIINSLCVFSFLIGLALLLKIVSYFHAKNWKFA